MKELEVATPAKTTSSQLEAFDPQKQVGVAILADVSGSMRGPRIKQLRRDLADLWRELEGKAVLFAFNHLVQQVKSPEELPEPHGFTKLAPAIALVNTLTPSILFVISDGNPHDDDQALEEAAKSLSEINVIFTGDPDDEYATLFMRNLARMGGGTFVKRDLAKGQAILEDMRTILGLPAPTSL